MALGLALAVYGPGMAAESPSASAEPIGERPPDYLLTPESLAEGKRTFIIYCSICHGDGGWGGFCPNLTDDETLHGPRFADMLTVITNGAFATPMPRWVGRLGFERVSIVAAYVYTLKGTRLGKTGFDAPRPAPGAARPPAQAPRAILAAEESPAPPSADGPPAELLKPESLEEGRHTFLVHCTTCHGQTGGGGLGPNLTDKETVHGGRFADMLNVIMNGVELKGMPRWINLLGAERVAQVAAYVYTLQGTKPPSKSNIRFSVILLAPAVRLLR